MPTTYLWFLFDWRGRIDRTTYRVALLALVLIHKLFDVVPDHMPAMALFFLALKFVINMALDAKRLHDTGASAIWIVGSDLIGMAGVFALMQSGVVNPKLLAAAYDQLLMLGDSGVSLPPWLLGGVAVGTVLRSPWLAYAPSSKGANAFDFNPRAGLLQTHDVEPDIDAEAIIARALAERNAASRTPVPRPQVVMPRPAGPGSTRTFGKRGSN